MGHKAPHDTPKDTGEEPKTDKEAKARTTGRETAERTRTNPHRQWDSPMPSGYIFRHFRYGQKCWLSLILFVCPPAWPTRSLNSPDQTSLPRGKGLTPAITHSFVNRAKVQRNARIISKWIINQMEDHLLITACRSNAVVITRGKTWWNSISYKISETMPKIMQYHLSDLFNIAIILNTYSS